MKIKKITALILCFAVLTGCSAGKDTADTMGNSKTIKIAVLKNSREQQAYFEKGIERAYKDVLEEYKDSGFDIQCEFYDNSGTYEEVERLTKELTKDKQLTAIVGSDNPEFSESQLYVTQKKGKILISPGRMYDDRLTANDDLCFYMSYRTEDIGELLMKIAETMPDVNLAVCTANDKITRQETQGFRNADFARVMDYVNTDELNVYFDRIILRWKNLGINGVVMMPHSNDGFELLYRLKREMPDLCVITDSDMDNQREYNEHSEMYNNFYIADIFSVDKSNAEYVEYTEKTGPFEDTWETHGYNSFRMIVDTAVKNNTANPRKIAEIIHTSGYKGKGETFNFEKNGTLIPESFEYYDGGNSEVKFIPAK